MCEVKSWLSLIHDLFISNYKSPTLPLSNSITTLATQSTYKISLNYKTQSKSTTTTFNRELPTPPPLPIALCVSILFRFFCASTSNKQQQHKRFPLLYLRQQSRGSTSFSPSLCASTSSKQQQYKEVLPLLAPTVAELHCPSLLVCVSTQQATTAPRHPLFTSVRCANQKQ